ncbi:hypothetical protein DTO282F9_9120 [Paecilomyces variotii]|nr:hypothetical protein DTO282F9_9120 [Paecilomyces variotii]
MASEVATAACMPMPSTHSLEMPSSNLRLSNSGSGELSLAVNTEWFWDVGKLHVRFLNHNDRCQQMVKDAAKIWEKYANIQFVFDDSSEAEIRILFDTELKGGSSLVGKHKQKETPLDKPTMILGSGLSDREFKRTALHELGHALGCVHEHCSPVASIDWDEEKVVSWYEENSGCSLNRESLQKWVRANITRQYNSSSSFQTTEFDERSIMVYQILPGWAKKGYCVDWPDSLSEADKMLIRRIYRTILPTTEIGQYSTQDSRLWYQPKGENVMEIELNSTREKEPNFTVGITHFDLEREENMNLKAYADDFQRDSFKLHLDSKSGTTQYSAAATCLVSERHDFTFQSGTYATRQKDQTDSDGKEYKAPIKFERAFRTTPGLVVWLKAFQFDKGGRLNVHAYAGNSDRNGFDLHIDSWDDARLVSAEVSWIAYETDPPGIHSGVLTFQNFRENEQQYGDTKRHQIKDKKLGEWQLRTVYAAISKFDFESPDKIRLSLKVNPNVSAFEIDAMTWADSKCHGAEVSYLAVCA